jgi:hypothetical protein
MRLTHLSHIHTSVTPPGQSWEVNLGSALGLGQNWRSQVTCGQTRGFVAAGHGAKWKEFDLPQLHDPHPLYIDRYFADTSYLQATRVLCFFRDCKQPLYCHCH